MEAENWMVLSFFDTKQITPVYGSYTSASISAKRAFKEL